MRDWMDDAECAQIGTEMFFPNKGGSTAIAKKICGRCTVASQCLESALELPGYEDHGVRGGLTEKERRLLRKSAA